MKLRRGMKNEEINNVYLDKILGWKVDGKTISYLDNYDKKSNETEE